MEENFLMVSHLLPSSNLLMSLTQFLCIIKNNNNSHDEEEKVFSLANGSEKVVGKIVKA